MGSGEDDEERVVEGTISEEVRRIFRKFGGFGVISYRAAWAKYFGTKAGTAEFYQGLSYVVARIASLKTEIDSSALRGPSKRIYLAAVDELAKYVSAENHGNASAALNESEAYERLTLLDDNLRSIENRVVSEKTLEGWAEELRTLIAQLSNLDLNPRLKGFVLGHLRALIWAIDNFDVVGIDGISRTWGAMSAEVLRSQGMKGGDKPAAKAWYKRAMVVFGVIGAGIIKVSAYADGTENLLEHSQGIIGLLTAPEGETPAPSEPEA